MPKYDGLGEGKLPCLCAVSYKPFSGNFFENWKITWPKILEKLCLFATVCKQ